MPGDAPQPDTNEAARKRDSLIGTKKDVAFNPRADQRLRWATGRKFARARHVLHQNVGNVHQELEDKERWGSVRDSPTSVNVVEPSPPNWFLSNSSSMLRVTESYKFRDGSSGDDDYSSYPSEESGEGRDTKRLQAFVMNGKHNNYMRAVLVNEQRERGLPVLEWRRRLDMMLNSGYFELFTWMGAICNAAVACSNVGNNYNMDGTSIFELVYLVYFSCEVSVRIVAGGPILYFNDPYNANDFMVLCAAQVPFTYCAMVYGLESDLTRAYRKVTVARLFRVLRVADWLRMKPMFYELAIITQGIGNAFHVLMWGTVVGTVLILVFGVFIATVCTDGRYFQKEIYNGVYTDMVGFDVADYAIVRFGTLGASMLSLFQVLTLDGWAEMIDPLVVAKPWLTWYFMFFIVTGVYMFLNLITAVIVESATRFQKGEVQRKQSMRKGKKERLFRYLRDELAVNGIVDNASILHAYQNDPRFRTHLSLLNVSTIEDVEEYLSLLYMVKGVGVGEFVEGLEKYSEETITGKNFLEINRSLTILKQDIIAAKTLIMDFHSTILES